MVHWPKTIVGMTTLTDPVHLNDLVSRSSGAR